MTTSHPVSTIEDIIRILREQPEVREAVRREILTEELLDSADIAQFPTYEAASEYSPGDLDSFTNCDLVILAESPTEGECYIVVQVSYTVDHSDIDRAITHSQMLTLFTGRPAYAVVAGMERARVTEHRLASGSVHWYRIPRSAVRPRSMTLDDVPSQHRVYPRRHSQDTLGAVRGVGGRAPRITPCLSTGDEQQSPV